GEPFDALTVMRWAETLLDALAYIHGQHPAVIHRDIKPQNLKLTPRGELFLIDFGLAKDATTPTRAGASIHAYTLAYAPPEQIKGTGTDARSDLYSLGATLYHLATGELPPDARVREEAVVKYQMPDLLRPAHQVNPRLPFGFASVLARAMALDRAQRHQTAREMQQAIRPIREALEKQRQEEERKHREEEARLHELEEQRLRQEAARRKTIESEIYWKKEELARLQSELQGVTPTERTLEQPVTPEPKNDPLKTVRVAADKAKPPDEGIPPAKPPAKTRGKRPLAIGGAGLAVALLVYLIAQIPRTTNNSNPSTPVNSPATVNLGDASTETINGVKLEMIRVPAGSFQMGSPENEPERASDEGPQHRVTVSGFSIGKFEVTQAQWKAVMGSNPSNFKGDNLPVENVSWNDAKEFCRKLSQLTGKQYRLPTEAEWEYAARAGTTTPFAFGSSLSSQQANFDGNSPYGGAAKGVYRQKTMPVGSFAANAFQLHDMHGNVWEWCEDVWHENYNGAPSDGSSWLSGGDSSSRVLRGGSWYNDGWLCRSAVRGRGGPGDRNGNIGFRVVVSASIG
ncbi:MAG: SUMF1/EgtB/PvdO family nonheme iron enzyme, partial [Blastocatellia bacterium]